MWKVLLSESFRAWAAVLLALPVNLIIMLNFARPEDAVNLIGFVFATVTLAAVVGLALSELS